MVFDWNENSNEILESGMFRQSYWPNVLEVCSDGGMIEGHIFRNFDNLKIEDWAWVKDCVFENCGQVHFEKAKVMGCVFDGGQIIFGAYSGFINSEFKNMHCESDPALCLEVSDVQGCKFENIELEDDAYLCEGKGECVIAECSFENISTDSEDDDLFDEMEIYKRCTGEDAVRSLKHWLD